MEMFNERIKGGPPMSAAVGTSSSEVLAVNAKRRYAIFVNDGDYPVYLALHETAEVNKGIRVNPGDSYEISYVNYYTGVVSAVSSTDVNLCYLEG